LLQANRLLGTKEGNDSCWSNSIPGQRLGHTIIEVGSRSLIHEELYPQARF